MSEKPNTDKTTRELARDTLVAFGFIDPPRDEMVKTVAKETGLSESIVSTLSGSDLATLRDQAWELVKLKPDTQPEQVEHTRFVRELFGV